MFSAAESFDHSWSVLSVASNANCGLGCTSSATNVALGNSCCQDSQCLSGFCQCQKVATYE